MPKFGEPFDFRDGLPDGLVLAKPVEQGSYDDSVIAEYEKKWPIMATRKWNGYRVIITVTAGDSGIPPGRDIRIFTDGKHKSLNGHVPHIALVLRELDIPLNSVLVGELVAERNSVERLGSVTSIVALKDPREAWVRQEKEGRLKLILHGILCWNNVWHQGPYDQSLVLLSGLFGRGGGTHVNPVRMEHGPLTEVKERAVSRGWEGLVLYRHDYLTTWRLDGPDSSSPRPDGSYKWKPQTDGDFIVGEVRMSDKRAGRIKDVMLLQIDPEIGRVFRCGRLGNFSAADDGLLQKRLAKRGRTVLEVRFDGRHPSGKLVSPRFVRIRTDKRPTQCVAEKSFDSAEFVK